MHSDLFRFTYEVVIVDETTMEEHVFISDTNEYTIDTAKMREYGSNMQICVRIRTDDGYTSKLLLKDIDQVNVLN